MPPVPSPAVPRCKTKRTVATPAAARFSFGGFCQASHQYRLTQRPRGAGRTGSTIPPLRLGQSA